MTKLINAEPLRVWTAHHIDETGCIADFKVVSAEDIEKASTVDTEPVIRCKDCLYFAKCDKAISKNYKIHNMGYCVWFESNVAEDDFCSWAVKKEGKQLNES